MLDEPAVRDLVGELFEVKRQANTDTTAPFLAALSLVRLGLVSPEAAEEAYPDASGIAEGFDRFRDALAERGQVDFDEQIYRAIEILAADPVARAAAQARCRRMLVDEFQDLTPAHLLLIRLLAAPGFDCFGVGDDDQVIYGYSGATPEFLIDFATYFPGAADHPLEVNYRCPPAVVDAARHLLSYNHERVVKTIRSPEGRTDPAPVPHRACWPAPARWWWSGRPPTPWPAGRWRSIDAWRGRRGRSRRHRRAGPGQFGAAARAGGLPRVRRAVHDAADHPGPGAHRHPHGVRLPPHRQRSGRHPARGHPRHRPAAVAGHRPDGGGHDDQAADHLGGGHPSARLPALGP